jgi:hypothetical protein
VKKYILVYTAGVLTTPAVVFIFRKPISAKVGDYLVDEKFDEPLFRFMTSRTDKQDLRRGQRRGVK